MEQEAWARQVLCELRGSIDDFGNEDKIEVLANENLARIARRMYNRSYQLNLEIYRKIPRNHKFLRRLLSGRYTSCKAIVDFPRRSWAGLIAQGQCDQVAWVQIASSVNLFSSHSNLGFRLQRLSQRKALTTLGLRHYRAFTEPPFTELRPLLRRT